MFQSTHPHGVRQVMCGSAASNMRVSIHAPTWGATSIFFTLTYDNEFQSTHPHGVRRSPCLVSSLVFCFNPRTHMGCDPSKPLLSNSGIGFNPRTHMGCDIYHFSFWSCLFVSIHAPTWGATAKGLLKLRT